ncbi:5-formyltetrahydrofolate cyclo-ligase [Sulfolobus tengchongensis]|uniref:5-formyltetrahydrofolate cyclo-ligase n=1 Tax=Sulfolobus tengchongensis TaxID=207809 RepID=A0AAX4L294_9CREN
MLSKQEIRQMIWKKLEYENIALFPRPVYGRIPNFKGADKAAFNLAKCVEFQKSEVIKVNPDSPQYKIREIALREGKKVLVPTPRLRGDFFLLDPNKISVSDITKAARISGFSKYGIRIQLEDIDKVDLIVAGSVAVDLNGNRVGKGEGYSELEFAILRELGKVNEITPIATTVHDIQIVDEIPVEPYDVPIDIIATPTRIIRINRKREKPKGIYLEYLSRQKIEDTPFLKEYLKKRRYNTL